MTAENIREKLFLMQDLKYRDFTAALIPTVDKDTVIGVRTPALKSFAKELMAEAYKKGDFSEINLFLDNLPHGYYEENNLHAFIVSEIKDFEICINKTSEFLPFINNWATCDSFRPKCFAKNKEKLIPYIKEWLSSGKAYIVRYAIELLMIHFLDESFSESYLDTVSKIKSDEYYVNMMIAWYFAEALAKQYNLVVLYFQTAKLSPWVHNKAIQKARESFRISPEKKEYLKALKLKICKQ